MQCACLGGHVPLHLPASEIARFHTLLYCRETLQELLAVAKYARIQPYLPRVKKIAGTMLRLGVEVRPSEEPIDLPDPDDAVYLQTALARDDYEFL